MAGRSRTIGMITRGTTNTNRLRRVDRWIAAQGALRSASDPLVVDLGYGASAVTTFELWSRLARARPDVSVVGLEIDPGRVTAARAQLDAVKEGRTPFDPGMAVSFERGGFEVPLPLGRRAAVIRAFNVLRQYREDEVAGAWARMTARLQPGGILAEGTCDEIGRVSSWVALGPDGPHTFTVSLRLPGLESPAVVAERLPKALIHRNVPGERIHDFIAALDSAWTRAAPLSSYGVVQRWLGAVSTLKADGWPVIDGTTRWRLGEVTVPWQSVAPA